MKWLVLMALFMFSMAMFVSGPPDKERTRDVLTWAFSGVVSAICFVLVMREAFNE